MLRFKFNLTKYLQTIPSVQTFRLKNQRHHLQIWKVLYFWISLELVMLVPHNFFTSCKSQRKHYQHEQCSQLRPSWSVNFNRYYFCLTLANRCISTRREWVWERTRSVVRRLTWSTFKLMVIIPTPTFNGIFHIWLVLMFCGDRKQAFWLAAWLC